MAELDRLRELVAINRAITSSLAYEEVLELVVRKTAEFTGADACLLILADTDDMASVACSVGIPPDRLSRFPVPLDEHINETLRALLDFHTEDTFLAVPIVDHGHIAGLLAVYRKGPEAPQPEEELLLSALADQAAIALSHAAHYRQIRRELHNRVTLTDRIFAEAPLGIFVLDPRFVLQEVNVAGQVILGRSRDELVGHPLSEVAGSQTGRLKPLLKQVLAGESVAVSEFMLENGGGATFWDARGMALPDEHGRPVAILVMIWDATEQARHAAALAEANEAKDFFFNALSHELRTPLGAILNAVTLSQRPGASPEQIAQAGRIIERNALHQARLVDDLLDLSRIMHGKVLLEHRVVDLCQIVRAEIESIEATAREGRLALHLELSSSPLWISGDRVRISQVVTNLLTNAVRYSNPGGVISVSARADGEEAVLRVRDTGIGIDPEVQRHLFQPFRQADTSLARTRGGLGIGLAIVRALVEGHGGRIDGSSEGLGRGSEFTLRLPLTPERPDPELELEAPRWRAGRRVLVVDDNEDLRTTLVTLLEMEGCDVMSAADGRSALLMIEREHPDVALLDVGLPDLDGYELAARIRENSTLAGVMLVALTGYAGAQHRKRALEAGFDAHVAKPVEVETLLALIAAA